MPGASGALLETEVKALAAEGIVANTVGVVVGAEGEAVGNGGIDAGVFCGATPLAGKLGFVERRGMSGADGSGEDKDGSEFFHHGSGEDTVGLLGGVSVLLFSLILLVLYFQVASLGRGYLKIVGFNALYAATSLGRLVHRHRLG